MSTSTPSGRRTVSSRTFWHPWAVVVFGGECATLFVPPLHDRLVHRFLREELPAQLPLESTGRALCDLRQQVTPFPEDLAHTHSVVVEHL
ncbi:MAG TPA: hypothetical protein VFH36_17115 [Acidimicrobiales bacterium]|nr:hypothetical protein [Acidimicrobiales bacterium]